jgi:hypothetical protein
VISSNEFDNFDRTMRELMKVPHEKIKAELDAEKANKKPRQKRKKDDSRNQDHNPVK